MNRPTEDELIATYFAPVAGPGGLGLRDDAALIRPEAGTDLVVTVDALVATVHFFADDAPASIAVKALGVNLSDLAAKGADPLGFVLALALPSDWDSGWVRDFSAGLDRCAHDAGCPLLGGDTVRTPGPLTVSITAFGQVPSGKMVRRTGAQAGDLLYVSGTIGDAALGLRVRSGADWRLPEVHRAALIDRYLHPQPRLSLTAPLRDHANGAMDISDGLIGDARKMMSASGMAGRLDLARVPLSAATAAVVASDPDALLAAVTGGDDYEILAAVPPALAPSFEAAAREVGIAVRAIGQCLAGPPTLSVVDESGEPVRFDRPSFSHF